MYVCMHACVVLQIKAVIYINKTNTNTNTKKRHKYERKKTAKIFYFIT